MGSFLRLLRCKVRRLCSSIMSFETWAHHHPTNRSLCHSLIFGKRKIFHKKSWELVAWKWDLSLWFQCYCYRVHAVSSGIMHDCQSVVKEHGNLWLNVNAVHPWNLRCSSSFIMSFTEYSRKEDDYQDGIQNEFGVFVIIKVGDERSIQLVFLAPRIPLLSSSQLVLVFHPRETQWREAMESGIRHLSISLVSAFLRILTHRICPNYLWHCIHMIKGLRVLQCPWMSL